MAEGRRGARDSEVGRRTGTGAGASASDDGISDGGAVELSLHLRTGSSAAAEEKEEKAAAAAAAATRSMTIFYNGRVCAADVTEHQAWAIISMVNQEIFTEQQQRRDHGRHHQDSGGGHQNPTPAALLRSAHCHAAPSSHQVLSEAAAAPPLISHAASGLSMKRSLQRFLQKRKTRAAAAASRYTGARPDQPMKP